MRYYKHLYLTEGLERKRENHPQAWNPENCSRVCM